MTRRALALLRKHGVIGLCRKVVRRCVARCIYSHERVLVVGLDTALRSVQDAEGAPPAVVVPLALADVEAVACEHPDFLTAQKLQRFRERHARGDNGYAAYRCGELAHILWTRAVEELDAERELGAYFPVRIPLDEPGLLLCDGWTPEQHRGRGVFTAVLRHVVRLASEGQLSVWGFVFSSNVASRAGLRRLGFEPYYCVHSVRWLGRFCRAWVESIGVTSKGSTAAG